MTRFDETTLQKLSASTGGRYFRSATGGELRAALEGAVTAERRRIGWATTGEYRDIYMFLLAAAGSWPPPGDTSMNPVESAVPSPRLKRP